MSGKASRIDDLDALRGFALLGILPVNIGSFASAYFGTGLDDPRFGSTVDRAVRWLLALLFETKFYLLFSFLFGYSFTLQMASAERDGVAFMPRMLRRLLGLALLGVLHALLLYSGDILLTYALLGLPLLAARHTRPRTAVLLGVTLICATALGWATLAWLAEPGVQGNDAFAARHRADLAEQVYRLGGAPAIAQRVRDLLEGTWLVIGLVQAPCAMAMFLFGLAAGKTGWVVSLAERPRVLKRITAIGLGVGLPGAAAYAGFSHGPTSDRAMLWALSADLLTAPFLTAAYGALLLLARRRGLPAGGRLASAGRMALSNYLMQSLACALVFTGYGLGWVGQVAPLPMVGLALAIYALQLVASDAWLQRHPYGPVEWLLRAWTLLTAPRWSLAPQNEPGVRHR